MKQRDYIDFLGKIEKLKCNTRHSWTSSGRRESVAEHSWRLAVMAMLCADEYPQVDINKVIKMCLIHDFGEAVTGDIPSFYKTEADEHNENVALMELIGILPEEHYCALSLLFQEIDDQKTPEAKLFKSLDNIEAVISHNEADIKTWLPLEFKENQIYGEENCEWSEWIKNLRKIVKDDTLKKIQDINNFK